MRFTQENVQYMPQALEPGVLYVSREFGIAIHLCPCGCGAKIRTPLGPTEWLITETPEGPSLSPSVGNWQQRCQSHYWITRGEVRWAEKWTPEQVLAGREHEDRRRLEHYEAKYPQRPGLLQRIWRWLMSLFGR